MAEITGAQQEVLDATDNVVVVGPPGSGKTTVALWRAQRIIKAGGLAEHQKVLFLSFSRGAVGRIAAAARLELSREPRRRLKIATYHSFCHEMLSAHCALLRLRPPFHILLPEEVTIIKNEVEKVAEELKRLEIAESRVPFERFAPRSVELLRRYPVLLRAYGQSYPLIIVDEYQDTDDTEDEFVRLLGGQCQIVCLGDADQRIYDYRAGSRADRLETLQLKHGFRRIDLGTQNHRNATSGIREYAQSILAGVPIESKAVHVIRTPAGHDHLIKKICNAVTFTRSRAARERWGGARGPSIAVMLPTNDLVRLVSRELQELPEEDRRRFRHEVFVDQAELGIAWDLILDLLDGVSVRDMAGALQGLLSNVRRYFRHRGGSVALKKAGTIEAWQRSLSAGTPTRSQFIPAVRTALAGAKPCTGNPIDDLRALIERLTDLPGDYLTHVVELLELRCPGMSEAKVRNDLAQRFVEDGNYAGAGGIGRRYMLMETLLDSSERRARLSIMTLHRSKGSEFDAVVIAETSREPGRFVIRDDQDGFAKSRRLLHMALTRARYRATILTPVFDVCPLIKPTTS